MGRKPYCRSRYPSPPRGLSWSGPGVPAGSALPIIIHLFSMINAGGFLNSGRFGSLSSKSKPNRSPVTAWLIAAGRKRRSAQPPMRKWRSFLRTGAMTQLDSKQTFEVGPVNRRMA
jgi:hypothetical protein